MGELIYNFHLFHSLWSFTVRLPYSLIKKLGYPFFMFIGPQRGFGRCGEEKNILLLSGIELMVSGCPSYSLPI
jgi:hypothetical protein